MNKTKEGLLLLKSVEVINPYSIPGATGADQSINQSKYPGIVLSLGDGVVRIEYRDKVGLIPLGNIRGMVVEQDEKE